MPNRRPDGKRLRDIAGHEDCQFVWQAKSDGGDTSVTTTVTLGGKLHGIWRIESGRLQLRRRPLKVDILIQDCLDRWRPARWTGNRCRPAVRYLADQRRPRTLRPCPPQIIGRATMHSAAGSRIEIAGTLVIFLQKGEGSVVSFQPYAYHPELAGCGKTRLKQVTPEMF